MSRDVSDGAAYPQFPAELTRCTLSQRGVSEGLGCRSAGVKWIPYLNASVSGLILIISTLLFGINLTRKHNTLSAG
jgi:hypothetical protein